MDIIEEIIKARNKIQIEINKSYVIVFDTKEEFVESYIIAGSGLDREVLEDVYDDILNTEGEKVGEKACIRITICKSSLGRIKIQRGHSELGFYERQVNQYGIEYIIIESKNFDFNSLKECMEKYDLYNKDEWIM